MAFRFVHTADLHLDSPLRTLALRDPELAGLIGGAMRQVLGRIVDLCLSERVDALLIAGDLYDGDLRSMKTAAFLRAELARLDEADIAVYLIRGNHDAESTVTKLLDLPPNVHVFDGRGGVVAPENAPVAIHGVSFGQKHAPDSLLPKLRPPVAGRANIGLLHTSLAGAEGHDVYAPCAVGDLIMHGFDYWALGHIHKRQVHGEAPHIVMPGIPQGRDIGEAGAKSVSLVTVDDRGIACSERLTSVAEFGSVAVDVSGLDAWDGVRRAIADALGRARDAARSDHLVARLRLTGASTLGWRLRRDREMLFADAREAAGRIGTVWIEGLTDASRPPESTPRGGDPTEELHGLIESAVLSDPGFLAEVEGVFQGLMRQLPPQLRDRFGTGEDEQAAVMRQMIGEGYLDVLSALRAAPRGEHG